MDSIRRQRADEAFALYDMGDMEVKDTGTWQRAGDEWSMSVFIENGDSPSTKLTFVVRFLPCSTEVNEAYFAH